MALNVSLQDLEASIARDKAKLDPVKWLHSMKQFPWSTQRLIMESVRDNRYTAVPACHGPGKALRDTTPVLTPGGWVPIGKLVVGDHAMDQRGKPITVTGVYPQGVKDLFTVRFRDGAYVDADRDHLWKVRRWHGGVPYGWQVLTTAQILARILTDSSTGIEYAIPNMEEFTYRDRVIASITPTNPGPATCISVDSPDRCFVTKDYIVTHNSWLAAWLTIWWLSVHTVGEALVVTTATTTRQVRDILWKEIGRAHGISNMPGRTNQMELILPNPATGKEEIVALGMKPADMDPVAFSGRHERFVLIIGDEAGGLHKTIIEGTGNLMTNKHCRQLLIGNPDDPTAEFANLCSPVDSIPNGPYMSDQGYQVIPISVFDTPNFTGEQIPDSIRDKLVSDIWVNEKTRKWGKGSPMYLSKILGQFPPIATDKLIPLPWILEAQRRNLDPGTTRELGVDVGRGGDESTYCLREGRVARIIGHDTVPDVMVVTRKVVSYMETRRCTLAKIDSIGIGAGVVDRARELKKAGIIGVNVGGGAHDKANFANLRAEGFWNLRQLFEDGDIDIDPDDTELAAELANIDYDSSSGKIILKSKKQMRAEGQPSPNRAESLMLAFIQPRKIKPGPLVWSTGSTFQQGTRVLS